MKRCLYYVLDDQNNAIPCEDVLEWGEKFADFSKRQVADTSLLDTIRVSTVFIGIDHAWNDGPPLVFESMVFGGEDDGYMERYSTWEEAEKGHHNIVAKILLDKSLGA